jgi:hypothetical protein
MFVCTYIKCPGIFLRLSTFPNIYLYIYIHQLAWVVFYSLVLKRCRYFTAISNFILTLVQVVFGGQSLLDPASLFVNSVVIAFS